MLMTFYQLQLNLLIRTKRRREPATDHVGMVVTTLSSAIIARLGLLRDHVQCKGHNLARSAFIRLFGGKIDFVITSPLRSSCSRNRQQKGASAIPEELPCSSISVSNPWVYVQCNRHTWECSGLIGPLIEHEVLKISISIRYHRL